MNKFIILGHENPDVDSIVSGYLLEKILNKKGYDGEYVIPDMEVNRETIDICFKYGLDPNRFKKKIDLSDKSNKYILVDHFERDLGGEIVCIIDHHPTNKEIMIDNYYNKQISSTACYIACNNEDLLNEFDLKLAVIATLVDTASFHSTKGRKDDLEWVLNICNKFGFNYDKLYKEGLCLTVLDDLDKASLNGLKKYNLNNKIIESSYIQIEDPLLEDGKIRVIIEKLKKYIKDNKIDIFVFIVYDMTKFKTVYYMITENKVDTRSYDGYSSRGNTIMPEIEKITKEN